MTTPPTRAELIERLGTLQATRVDFVAKREAMNAARPDPLHGTKAERDLYDERYRADHEAERALFRAALDFATWAADTQAADALASADAEIERLRLALDEIANPLAAIQRMAEAEGCTVNGAIALSLCNDPAYLQKLARTALTGEG